jgi:hypothetical protein
MEQPRSRPSEPTEQKQYFSGKKKQHTFKSQYSQIYQQVILTICGLVRLRIGALVLPVSSN